MEKERKQNIEAVVRFTLISDVEEKLFEAITQSEQEKQSLGALEKLEITGHVITDWIGALKGSKLESMLDDRELLSELAELKRQYIAPARKEVADQIREIIESGRGPITEEINQYMSGLQQRGINLDGVSENEFSSVIKQEKQNKQYTKTITVGPADFRIDPGIRI